MGETLQIVNITFSCDVIDNSDNINGHLYIKTEQQLFQNNDGTGALQISNIILKNSNNDTLNITNIIHNSGNDNFLISFDLNMTMTEMKDNYMDIGQDLNIYLNIVNIFNENNLQLSLFNEIVEISKSSFIVDNGYSYILENPNEITSGNILHYRNIEFGILDDTLIQTQIYDNDNLPIISWLINNTNYYPNTVITTKVTNMSQLFLDKYDWDYNHFSQDLSKWDTSNVTDMSEMFSEAYTFDGYIGNWNTSNVTTMEKMFYSPNQRSASNNKRVCDFNQNIGTKLLNTNTYYKYVAWDTLNVTNMEKMFYYADLFNQNISGWNLSSIQQIKSILYGAVSFNFDVMNWDIDTSILPDNSIIQINSDNLSLIIIMSNYNVWNMFTNAKISSDYVNLFSIWYLNEYIDSDGNFVSENGGITYNKSEINLISGWTPTNVFFSKDLPSPIVDYPYGYTNNNSIKLRLPYINDSQLSSSNLHTITVKIFNKPNIDKTYVFELNDLTYDGTDDSFSFQIDNGEYISETVLVEYTMIDNTNNVLKSAWNINLYDFKIDIFKWNTSNVTNMESMFRNCGMFNSSIESWNMSSVTNVSSMFEGATIFNQNIVTKQENDNNYISWDMLNVTNFENMFKDASNFNQNISNWNVSSGINFKQMFQNTNTFTYDIRNWDISQNILLTNSLIQNNSNNTSLDTTIQTNSLYNMFDNVLLSRNNLSRYGIILYNSGISVDSDGNYIYDNDTLNISDVTMINSTPLLGFFSKDLPQPSVEFPVGLVTSYNIKLTLPYLHDISNNIHEIIVNIYDENNNIVSKTFNDTEYEYYEEENFYIFMLENDTYDKNSVFVEYTILDSNNNTLQSSVIDNYDDFIIDVPVPAIGNFEYSVFEYDTQNNNYTNTLLNQSITTFIKNEKIRIKIEFDKELKQNSSLVFYFQHDTTTLYTMTKETNKIFYYDYILDTDLSNLTVLFQENPSNLINIDIDNLDVNPIHNNNVINISYTPLVLSEGDINYYGSVNQQYIYSNSGLVFINDENNDLLNSRKYFQYKILEGEFINFTYNTNVTPNQFQAFIDSGFYSPESISFRIIDNGGNTSSIVYNKDSDGNDIYFIVDKTKPFVEFISITQSNSNNNIIKKGQTFKIRIKNSETIPTYVNLQNFIMIENNGVALTNDYLLNYGEITNNTFLNIVDQLSNKWTADFTANDSLDLSNLRIYIKDNSYSDLAGNFNLESVNKFSNTFNINTIEPTSPIVNFPQENVIVNYYQVSLEPFDSSVVAWEYEVTLNNTIIKNTRMNISTLTFQLLDGVYIPGSIIVRTINNIGNKSKDVTNEYLISIDRIPPQIQLNGKQNIDIDVLTGNYIEEFINFDDISDIDKINVFINFDSEPATKIIDEVYNPSTASIENYKITIQNEFSYEKIGLFTIRYFVSDNTGNESNLYRYVHIKDNEAPVIILTGPNPQYLSTKRLYEEYGATAIDNYDGDVTLNIQIDYNNDNFKIPGTYYIKYNVKDSSKNAADEVKREVIVYEPLCGCIPKVPNFSINTNTSYNNSNISRKMFLAQRIRSNGKMNSNQKTKEKLNMYKTLYNRNQDEIKILLFRIGETRMNQLICFVLKSGISRKIKNEIQSIYSNVISGLSNDELEEIQNICS